MKKSGFLLALILALALALPLSASAKSDYEPQLIMGNMGRLVGVNKTNYLLAQDKGGYAWGIYNTDGAQLCPYKFGGLSYLDYNYFAASLMGDLTDKEVMLSARSQNNMALVSVSGEIISDFAYGYFRVFNEYWAVGWMLAPATEEDYDYKADAEHFFQIKQCDVFYLGDDAENGKGLVASLGRYGYKSAAAHYKYFSIMDREEQVIMYDSAFVPTNVKATSVSSPAFAISNVAIVCLPTGEVLQSPYASVKEAQTGAGLRLIASRADFSGARTYYLLNLDGDELMPPTTAEITSVTADYVVLKENDLFGLYSLKEQRQLLPCEYDAVISNGKSVDPYISFGYLMAEKDGKRQIIDAYSGRTVYSITHSDSRTLTGITYYRQKSKPSSLLIISPFGNQTVLTGSVNSSRGSGYLFAMRLDGYYAVVNWDGEKLMGGARKAFAITDDDHIIAHNTGDLYDLYRLVPKR